jgi:hypothetical protein
MNSPALIKYKSSIAYLFALCITLISSCNNSNKPDPEFDPGKIKYSADKTQSFTNTVQPGNKNAPVIINNTTRSSQNNTAVGLNPEHGKPGHRCDIAVGAPLNSAPNNTTIQQNNIVQQNNGVQQNNSVQLNNPVAATQTNATGLNPEHGKPGHRCDIAVGAPLNSKPASTTTLQNNQVVTSTKKTVTAPGMNPPHGEPGHRCDIGVGTPLSQPVKSNPSPVVQTVSPIVNDSANK